MPYTPSPSEQPPSTRYADYGTALLRIGLGIMWLAHALLKWLVYTLPGTAAFFESVGIQGWMAYPVFVAETAGGVMLILGVYARQAALALIPVMVVAAWVHVPNGWLHTSTGGGWEYPLFLIVASVALWLIGDGAPSLRRSARFTPEDLSGRAIVGGGPRGVGGA